MKKCNRICEWNNPSSGCVKPETVECKMPNLFKGAKPQTNADRIRAMSDEELADLLDDFGACSRCRRWGNDCFPVSNTLDWLKQPVKDGDNNGR